MLPARRKLDAALLTPIGRSAAADHVAAQIKELIRTKSLASGDRLPNETQLAGALNVSRPMVRQALRGLAMMGVLETRGLAHVVSDLRPERLIAPMSFAVSLADYTVEVLFRSRAVIDPALAADAACRVTDAQARALREMAVAGENLIHDAAAFHALDVRFHGLVNEIADNALLQTVASTLYELGVDVRRVAWETSGVLARSARDHRAIAAAIGARDPIAAEVAMRRHVAHIQATTTSGPAAEAQ